MIAKVMDDISKGYAEVAPVDARGNVGSERYIAVDPETKRKKRAKRGDIVELKEIKNGDGVSKRIYFYFIPVIMTLIGILVTGHLSIPERILSVAILGIMGLVVAWILNRKARLNKRQEYRIVRIVQRSKEIIR